MVSSPVFYPSLSGADNLRVLTAAWGWPRARADARIAEALRLVDLTVAAQRAAKGYSTGMRQRLGIALALLADAPTLILDEPVNGLDPAGIVEIRDLVLALASGGRTILISSHLLTEVEKTCDRVTIVDHGRIVATGTPSALAGGGERFEVRLPAAADVAAARRPWRAPGSRWARRCRRAVPPVGRGRAGRGGHRPGPRRGRDAFRTNSSGGATPSRTCSCA